MSKEKFLSFIKKSSINIFKGVVIGISISLMFVIACIYVAVLSKSVDIAYDDGGDFADLVDDIANIFTDDDNYSRATKGIVANAQFEVLGETYVDIPVNSYNLVMSYNSFFDADNSSRHYVELDPFVPKNEVLYLVILNTTLYDESLVMYSYFYPINSYDDVYMTNVDAYFKCVGASSFAAEDNNTLDDMSYSYNIVYDSINESFWFVLIDYPVTFETGIPFTLTFYEVPTNDEDTSNAIDDIGSIIASGMTFGLDGITSSVSTAFDSVFLDNDGNLSNYSIFVFWALGVSVALGFFKYILDWILSLGSRK